MIYHNLDHSPAAIDINLPMLVRKVIDHLLWRIENPDLIGRAGITVSPRLRLPAAVNTSAKQSNTLQTVLSEPRKHKTTET